MTALDLRHACDALRGAWLRGRLAAARRSAAVMREARRRALAAEASARLRRGLDAPLGREAATWQALRATRLWHAAENRAHALELRLAALEARRLERHRRLGLPGRAARPAGATLRWAPSPLVP